MDENCNEVQITIIEAKGLKAADTRVFHKDTSDPYAVIKQTSGLFDHTGMSETKVVEKDLNPVWNETFPFRFSYKLSRFKFKVFDYDKHTKHDPLGKCSLPISAFFGKVPTGQAFEIDTWLPITLAHHDASRTGSLHVKVVVTFNVAVAMPGLPIPLPGDEIALGLACEFCKLGSRLPSGAQLEQKLDLNASIIGMDDEKIVEYVGSAAIDRADVGVAYLKSPNQVIRLGKSQSGDDKTISINLSMLPTNVEKLVILVRAGDGESLMKLKSSCIRLYSEHTLAFYSIGKGQGPDGNGIFLGVIMRTPDGWAFCTTAVVADGKTALECMVPILAHGKEHLGWNADLRAKVEYNAGYP